MDLRDISDLNRVVVIDNDKKDGKSLLDALQKERIGSVFLQVKGLSSLPNNPFPNISLVFLDLNLIDSIANPRDKAGYTLACLRKVVTPGSFYTLVIWSTHTSTDLEVEFRDILKDTDITPCVPPIALEKLDCKGTRGEYLVSKINARIRKQFKQLGAQSLFFKWGTLVSAQASYFTDEFVKNDDQRALSKKIHALAEAYAGKPYRDDLSRNALFTLNEALKGSIDSAVTQADLGGYDKRVYTKVARVDNLQKSSINTHLMVDPHKRLGPGCVFDCKAPSCQSHDVVTASMTGKRKVVVDLTPICDAAQKKNYLNHYIHCTLIPSDGYEAIRDNNNIYCFQNQFNFEGESYYLVTNLKSLEGLRKRRTPGADEIIKMKHEATGRPVRVVQEALYTDSLNNILFKFRDPVVLDIQQKVSSHMSRYGHAYLS